ncbi:MAG: HDOD domain-containing protein [Desulfobacterales bacterium]|nr:HDOD domain-containing protein [Desulfobacterales bacterium]
MNQAAAKQINTFFMELVETLVTVIEQKDKFMRGKSQKVADLCAGFAKTLKMSQQSKIDKIYFAGLLHDIGMVYIHPEIMEKPQELEDDEMAIVRQHPVFAEKILSNLSILKGVLPMIKHHHEAFDGTGYPDSLKGMDIPVGARILSVVDSYVAMTSERPHRNALEPREAIRKLQDGAGTKYDREILNRFVVYIKSTGILSRKKIQESRTLPEIVADVLEQFNQGKIDLPVLPQVVQKVEEVMKRDISKGEDLAKVIEKDAVISVRLISVANSPYYRGLEQIASVRTAISRLGEAETRNLVIAIANKSLYKTKNTQFRDLMERLWQHSLACAHSAVRISKTLSLGGSENYFFMGIIHDIGKVVLIKAISDAMPSDKKVKLKEVRSALREIHAAFGGSLMRRWKYPEKFKKVVTQTEKEEYTEHVLQEVLIVNLANHLADKIGQSVFSGEEIEDIMQLDSVKRLGLDADTVENITQDVVTVMKDMGHLF